MSQAGIINTQSGPPPPTVATSYLLDDALSAVPLANVLIVHGGVGAETSLGASNEIVITVNDAGFDWEEKSANFNAEIEHGYFCNNALIVTLPATLGTPNLTIGDTIIIYADTEAIITIQASTGQFIQFGSSLSSAGGTCNSLGVKGDNIELVFKNSDLTWHSVGSIGTWSTT